MLIIVWILSISLVVISLWINPNGFFANGTIIIGWLLFALQLTWNKSEFFYLKVKSIWFIIKNPECIWNLHVEYYGEFDETVFDKLDSLFTKGIHEIKITQLSKSRKIYRVGTLSFEVVFFHDNVSVRLQDLEVSYRRSKTIIENELNSIFEGITKTLKEDNTKYFLNVNFKEFNPYFGFFIRRLNSREISTFNVKLNVDSEKVTIGKEKIEIYTNSLSKLQTLSKDYLTLSPR